MRVLVTGGAGYIGSVITEELLNAEHEVTVFDNLSKGHLDAVAKGADFVEGDLLQTDLLQKVFNENKIVAVIHMAAYSLVGESMRRPRDYCRNNVEASIVLLNAMCDAGI